jgi:hypothetical protein
MRFTPFAFFSSLLFAGTLVSGCASTGVYRCDYRPPSMTVAAVKPVLYDAITTLAHKEGWDIVVIEQQLGYVEALAPAEKTLGVGMRERWRFDVADYQVNVTRFLEVQFDRDGEWMREEAVSSGYGYRREHEILSSLGRGFGGGLH